jgi:hypothetical protein
VAKPEAIKAGHIVAIGIIPGTAPRACYIGLVRSVDEYGIRITSVKWDDDLDDVRLSTEDFFVTWVNINSMLVCTEEEPAKRFVRDKAPQWQAEVESMSKEDWLRPASPSIS